MQNPSPSTIKQCLLRRQKILNSIGENGIAVLFSAPKKRRSNDTFYPYRQNSYFQYLTGFPEDKSVLILDGALQKSFFFCQQKNPELETWDGFLYGTHAAQSLFGFDQCEDIESLPNKLMGYLKGHQSLYYLWSDQSRDIQFLLETWQSFTHGRTPDVLPVHTIDLRLMLDEMRLIKDAHELDLLREAGRISTLGHIRAMQKTRPGLYEYQIAAELHHEFQWHGAANVAYDSIVAGGKNACTLHYVNNQDRLPENQLLLIDAGAEYQSYAGDVTRTFPISKRFSPSQKKVYEIVLAANEEVIRHAKAGVSYQTLHELTIRILTEGLLALNLLSGSLDENIEHHSYQRFYMHGFGHWLGLDVHDVGNRFEHGRAILLRENMCMTVEPGIYIPDDDDIPAEFRGIGIRIEDNIIIGTHSAENYTHAAPKKINEIEDLMNG